MRVLRIAMVLSTLVGTAACERQPATVDRDLAFLDSLSLYPQTALTTAAVASPLELGLTEGEEPKVEAKEEPSASAGKSTQSSRSSSGSSARRARRSSGGSYSSGSASTVRREPRVVTVKHTKRDAAIGAVSGAVLGAVVGGKRHRVRNAAIGAVAGGVIGAVIGNNVDKSTRVEY